MSIPPIRRRRSRFLLWIAAAHLTTAIRPPVRRWTCVRRGHMSRSRRRAAARPCAAARRSPRPHIAAAAACVLLAQPGLSAARVRQTLYRYADDLGAPGRDDEYGHGFPVLTQYFHDRLCPGRTFRDMPEPDFWSHAGLDYCIGAGLMAGTSDVTVSPKAPSPPARRSCSCSGRRRAARRPRARCRLRTWRPTRGTMPRCAGRTGRGSSGTSATTFDPDAPITPARTSRSSSMSSPAARSRRAARSRPSRMWAALRAMPTPRSPGRSSRGSSAASARTTACASRRAATPAARR